MQDPLHTPLNDFVRRVAGTYRGIESGDIRVVLLEMADHILPELVENLRRLAHRELTRRDLDVRLRTGVAAATGDEVILSDGSRIAARTVVSTVPSSAHPIIDGLQLPKERGRVKVDLWGCRWWAAITSGLSATVPSFPIPAGMVLLNRTRRAATVRVIEPLDVLSIPTSDFTALVPHLPALRAGVEEVMAARQRTFGRPGAHPANRALRS